MWCFTVRLSRETDVANCPCAMSMLSRPASLHASMGFKLQLVVSCVGCCKAFCRYDPVMSLLVIIRRINYRAKLPLPRPFHPAMSPGATWGICRQHAGDGWRILAPCAGFPTGLKQLQLDNDVRFTVRQMK